MLLARLLALSFALLAAAPALAQGVSTLAVLPLDKGAGSEQYDGLGKALAAMLVTDLSTAPGLQLVERDRLDAVMAELKLSDTAFVDPKTAQKLGKGLGAQFVVTGGYSVVADKFLLDARVFHVESAKIVKASDADGTVADFVAVEKELVEDLIDGLDVALSSADRRKLMVQAPTEAFDAFAKYGEGLQRRDEGKLDDAKTAFEDALERDPAFELARDALGDLRALLAAEEAKRADTITTARGEVEATILTTWPGPPGKPTGDVSADMHAAVGWALRLMVLEDQGRHCERYQEMWTWLDRVDWDVKEPERLPAGGGVFTYVLGKKVKELGFEPLPYDLAKLEVSRESAVSRVVYRGTPQFVLGSDVVRQHEIGSGLLGSMRRCFTPAEQLAEVDRMLARVRKHGLEQQTQGRSLESDWSFEEALELTWIRIRAEHFGADAQLQRRIEWLLAQRGETDPMRRSLQQALEDVARKAEGWQTSRWRRYARSEEVLVNAMRGVAEADPAVVDDGSAICRAALSYEKDPAKTFVARYDQLRAEESQFLGGHVDQAGRVWALMRDLGCLKGERARFASFDEVIEFVAEARKRPGPGAEASQTCRSGWSSIDTRLAPAFIDRVRATPELEVATTVGVLRDYHFLLVWDRCVEAS